MESHFSAQIERTLRRTPNRRRDITLRKIREICSHQPNYKPLSGRLGGYRRVHVNGSYVLIFHYEKGAVFFDRLEHHDTVYVR